MGKTSGKVIMTLYPIQDQVLSKTLVPGVSFGIPLSKTYLSYVVSSNASVSGKLSRCACPGRAMPDLSLGMTMVHTAANKLLRYE